MLASSTIDRGDTVDTADGGNKGSSIAVDPDSVLAKNPSRQLSQLAPILLYIAIATTGLSAGFMYLWNEVMIPGLARTSDMAYIEAMNGVNAVIRNPAFAVAFFGSFLAMLGTAAVSKGLNSKICLGLITVAIACYLFVLAVTFSVHVPMNEELLNLADTDLSTLDTATIRADYETRWNAWHLPRAYATLASFLALVAAAWFELKSSRQAQSGKG